MRTPCKGRIIRTNLYSDHQAPPLLPVAAQKPPCLEPLHDLEPYFLGQIGCGLTGPRKHLHRTPNAAFQYTYFDVTGSTESGAQGANLTVASRDADSLRSRLGLDLSYYGDWGVKVLPHAFVGWEHDFSDDDPVEASFAAGGSPFFVDVGERDSDALYYGAGVDVLLESNLSAFVHYERVTGEDTETYGIVAGLGVSF